MKSRLNEVMKFELNSQVRVGGWTNVWVRNPPPLDGDRFIGNIEPGSTVVDEGMIDLFADHFLNHFG